MPGRLGDDPLSRKRPPSAKDAPSAWPGPPAQQTSHNDVFFRRRTEDPQQKLGGPPDKHSRSLGEATNTDEGPEITEVAEIVRTAQAAKSTQGAQQLAGSAQVEESVPYPIDEPVEKTEQWPPAVPEPVATSEPPALMTREQVVPPPRKPEPQPQKSEGFFKRLFGRLGK